MKRLIPILLALVFLSSCGTGQKESDRYTAFDDIMDYAKPISFGEDNDIYVFCGQQNWQMIEQTVRASLEQTTTLVYEEKAFNLIPVSITEIDKYIPYKNLLFIGDLSGSDEVSLYMRKSLAKDFIERVQQSGGDLFIARNHSSRDQIVLYLLASDNANLSRITNLQAPNLYSIFLKRLGERLAYQAYRLNVIGNELWDKLPFSLKIPQNYRLYSNDAEGRFISLLYRSRSENREIPDKYISVYYEDMPANKVDQAWLIEKRNEIWGKYFEGDIINQKTAKGEAFKFNEYDGWKVIGAWENHKHLIGGAFQSFAFWHPETKRAYIVDNSVYFPAGDKLQILHELYMLSTSLRIK